MQDHLTTVDSATEAMVICKTLDSNSNKSSILFKASTWRVGWVCSMRVQGGIDPNKNRDPTCTGVYSFEARSAAWLPSLGY